MKPPRCKFSLAFIGSCNEPLPCSKHSATACCVCRQPATHECAHTGQFVCGFPLCDKCEGFVDETMNCGIFGLMNHGHRRIAP